MMMRIDPHPLELAGARAAERVLKARANTLQRVENARLFIDRDLGLRPISRPLTATAKTFADLATDTDYRTFYNIGGFKILRPAWGPQIMQFYVGLFGFRSLFAAKRAKPIEVPEDKPKGKNPIQRWFITHDIRELKDIARRDMTAITLLLFALDPARDHVFTNLMQKLRGVALKSPHTGEALSLDQLQKTYRIHSPEALFKILTHDSPPHWQVLPRAAREQIQTKGHGLMDAAKARLEATLSEAGVLMNVRHQLKALATQNPGLGAAELLERLPLTCAVRQLLKNGLHTLSQEAHPTPQPEHLRDWLLNHVKTEHVPQAFQTLQHLDALATQHGLPVKPAAEFVSRYAVQSSTPAHVIAFLITSLGLGFLPVWVNKVLAEKDFEKLKQKAESA